MDNLTTDLISIFQEWGASPQQADIFRIILVISLIVIGSFIANLITKKIIIKIVEFVIKKSKNEYDDVFIKKNVFNHLSHIVPALIIYFAIPAAFPQETENADMYLKFIQGIKALTNIYMIIAVLIVMNSFLNALNDVYEIIAEKKRITISIKQYIQVVKIIFIIVTVILVAAVLFGKKPGAIFAGLGAMTAVLMLIFKDSLLGFVASIQLSAYKMLKEGDWITMSSRGVDGTVMDISLSTVKVQNFNKTVSTVPTYALVSESFTNWNGMERAGGRRIKRSIHIDMNSIKFLSPEMIDKLKNVYYLSDYIEESTTSLKKWNQENSVSEDMLINGRALTNIGVLRVYIDNYIRDHFRVFKKYPKEKFIIEERETEKFVINDKENFIKENGSSVEKFLIEIGGKTIIENIDKFMLEFGESYRLEANYIYKIRMIKKIALKKGTQVEIEDYEKVEVKAGLFSDDMTVLVRQLAPTEQGVPIQIYVFAATIAWVEYEQIQGDLFDHIFAVINEFGLKIFQAPSGDDIKAISK